MKVWRGWFGSLSWLIWGQIIFEIGHLRRRRLKKIWLLLYHIMLIGKSFSSQSFEKNSPPAKCLHQGSNWGGTWDCGTLEYGFSKNKRNFSTFFVILCITIRGSFWKGPRPKGRGDTSSKKIGSYHNYNKVTDPNQSLNRAEMKNYFLRFVRGTNPSNMSYKIVLPKLVSLSAWGI